MKAHTPRRGPTIFELALLIAGTAVGLWLISDGFDLRQGNEEQVVAFVVFVLGGLSVVGPPLLLWQRYRSWRPLRLGELLWFCQGMASWLLWPPIILKHMKGQKASDSMAMICYFYGTPLMALYIVITLFAGGWLTRRRRHVRSWRDGFGLLLALAWACTGLYVLSLIYRRDIR